MPARQNEARFRSLVQHSSDVIMVIKPDLTIRFVSPSVTRVLRYDAGPLMGRAVIDLLHPDDQDRARAFLSDAVTNPGVSQPAEWRFRQLDGSLLNAETIATNLLEDPTVRGVVLNTRDVSERKRLEKELMHQAFHDPLTGLANRALFRDRVSHALQLRMRQRNAISVLFLDLDDFKKVNDSLGHAEGDRLLVAASERLPSVRSGGRHGSAAGRRRIRDPAGGRRRAGRPRIPRQPAGGGDGPSLQPERQRSERERQHRHRIGQRR
jgi:PAS domain S-box-containing protein